MQFNQKVAFRFGGSEGNSSMKKSETSRSTLFGLHMHIMILNFSQMGLSQCKPIYCMCVSLIEFRPHCKTGE